MITEPQHSLAAGPAREAAGFHYFHHPWPWLARTAVGGLLFCLAVSGVAEGDTNALLVLRTGGGAPLVTTNYPLTFPEAARGPRLVFDFGFATAETIAPGQFLDSFSLTLASLDGSQAALLCTVDPYGVQWLPANPGGIILATNAWSWQPLAFPDLAPELTYRLAFELSLLVPPELGGASALLHLDLFDNQNAAGSLAFVREVRVTQETPTNAWVLPVLQSSAQPAGPYADEGHCLVNTNQETITVAKFGPDRFYRLEANLPVTITRFARQGDAWQFAFEYSAVTVVLQSAAQVEGPYQDEADYQVDLTQRILRLARPAATRFYRLRSNLPVTIERREIVGDELVFYFEYRPTVLGLQSSAQVKGPYATENNAVVDHERQIIRLAPDRAARFYRLQPGSPYRLLQVLDQGPQLRLSYQRLGP